MRVHSVCRAACSLAVVLEVAVGSAQVKRVPIGYDPEPDDTPLRQISPRTDGLGFATQITNRGTGVIVAIGYAAIVERVGRRAPVTVLRSQVWSRRLARGDSTELEAPWLTAADLDRLQDEATPDRIQMFIAPIYIRYADGSEWNLPIDESASSSMDALRRTPPSIPRTLIMAAQRPAEGQPSAPCHDDHGKRFSPGATVVIRNEPGHLARCDQGRWVEIP